MTPVRCHPSSPYPLKPHERKDELETPSCDPPTTPGGDGSEILEDVPDYGFTNTRFQVLLGQASALGDDFDANTIWGPRPMPTAERAPSNTLAPNVIHAIDEGNGRDGDEAMESTDEAKAPAVVAVTTRGLNIMHSGHVGPPGTISFYLSLFHSTLTPVLLV